MKKLMKFFGIVAVAAMSLTACQNEFDEQVNVNGGETVVVDITANAPATRSAFGDKDGNAYPSTWSGNETVGFSVNGGAYVDVENESTSASAKFSGVALTAATEGFVYAVSPRNTNTSACTTGGFRTISDYYLNCDIAIPTEQTPSAKSVDESAHLLFAEYEITEGAIPASISMTFNHIAAYGKMNITGYNGGTIEKITLTATQKFVGQARYYFADNASANPAATKGEFRSNDSYASETLTLNTSNTKDVWFACFPVGTLTGNLTIVITDIEGVTYTKTLGTNGKLAFECGKVSNFTVDMSKDVTVDAPAAGEQSATITFDDKAKRTTFTTSQQVWEENGIIVTNNKASSTNNVGDYATPARFYKNSELIVEAPGNITEIVFDCNTTEYATNLKNSVTNVTASNDKVTVTLDGTETSYTCTLSGGQARMDAITVTYVEANPNLKDQNIEWSTGDQTIVYGFEDEFEVPVLEGAEGTVTYESSNTNVATVSADGVVALVEGAEGIATITATAAATGEFKKATAKVTITIEKASINDVADLTWDADSQEAKTITLTGKHLDKVADLITINTPANFTVVKNGFTLTITPKQVNETEEAIENTLEIRIKDGDTLIGQGRDVTLTQKGVVSGGEGGESTESLTFSSLNLSNSANLGTYSIGDVSVAFGKGTNTSNSPKYYTSDATARYYVNNTITFTSEKTITKIVITHKSNSYAKITDYTATDGVVTWTGSSQSVQFTGSGTGRIVSVEVTYAN